MPTYAYKCHACEHAYEQFRSMTEGHPEECPECGEKYGDEFGQDFSQHQTNFTGMQPTTVGQLAERNTKRLGREAVERMEATDRTRVSDWSGSMPEGAEVVQQESGKLPWWRDGSVPGLPRREKPADVKTAIKEAAEHGVTFNPKVKKPKR